MPATSVPTDTAKPIAIPPASVSTTIPANVPIYHTLADFDRNLPATVRLLHTASGSRVYLIGTAHFSALSLDDVSLVMQNVRPDKLVLELCPLRLDVLHLDEERLLRQSIELTADKRRHIYRELGLIGGAFYIKLLHINAELTRQLGVAPGGECRRGLAEAQHLDNGCEVLLGDRSIDVTMQRAIRSMTLLDRCKMLLFNLLVGTAAAVTPADVEALKGRLAADIDQQYDDDWRSAMPAVYNAFVRERDLLLCHSLQIAAADVRPVNVVGIVGIGHSNGIVQNWSRERLSADRLAELLSLPPERLSHRLARSAFRWGVLGLCGYGVYKAVVRRSE